MTIAAQPEAALSQRLHGHLSAAPVLGVTRWLLGPDKAIPAHVHRELIKELDVSFPGIFISIINLMIFNLWCCWDQRSPFSWFLLVLNICFSTLRLLACKRVLKASAAQAAARTDVYVLGSLAWFMLQGVLTGWAQFTGNTNLEVLGTACAIAMLGPLCARNYAAPRFAMAIILAVDLPYLVGCGLSPSRELWAIIVFSPGFLLSCHGTIRRFQKMSIATLEARLVSEKQARHDSLTGALSRYGLLELLNQAIPPGGRLAFLHLDIDDFKVVNDRYGHQAGDALLQQVAAFVRAMMPEDGAVARIGGDEFIMLLPGFGPSKSAALAAQMIERIAKKGYQMEGDRIIFITASIGIACAPEDAESPLDLYRKADQALYAAKAKGKGAWQHFQAAA